jgi:hypothetical protein
MLRAAVYTRNMDSSTADAMMGMRSTLTYDVRKVGRKRQSVNEAPSGVEETVSVQPMMSRYALVPPAWNAFSDPMACAHGRQHAG